MEKSRRIQFRLSTILWIMFLFYPCLLLTDGFTSIRWPVELLLVIGLSFVLKMVLDRRFKHRRPEAHEFHPLDD